MCLSCLQAWAACTGLQVQTWTESPRFPSYCPHGCEPPGYNFSETINVKKIKITADIPEWRAENIAKGQVCHHTLRIVGRVPSWAPKVTILHESICI